MVVSLVLDPSGMLSEAYYAGTIVQIMVRTLVQIIICGHDVANCKKFQACHELVCMECLERLMGQQPTRLLLHNTPSQVNDQDCASSLQAEPYSLCK